MHNKWPSALLLLCVLLLSGHLPVHSQNAAPVVLSQQFSVGGAFNSEPVLTTDHSGGCFVVFKSRRGREGYVNLYFQHIDRQGRPVLGANGVPVCPSEANQAHTKVHFDSQAGLFVIWQEKRSGEHSDLFMQRINERGEPLWAIDGLRISLSDRNKHNPHIITDGNNGLYVFWEEEDPLLKTRRIVGQHISASGERRWSDTGRQLIAHKGRQQNAHPAWAPNGKFVLLWEDFRERAEGELFVQKFDSTGRELWRKNGLPLRRADVIRQRHPVVYGDGFGGLLCAYEGVRETGDQAILMLRVTRHGDLSYHRLVTLTSSDQRLPQIYQKGSKAVVLWQDETETHWQHRLQLFEVRSGERVWPVGGFTINPEEPLAERPQLAFSSVYGSIVLAWQVGQGRKRQILTQKVTADREKDWGESPLPILSENEDVFDFTLVEDEQGGAWYVWTIVQGEGTRLMFQGVDHHGKLKFRQPRALLQGQRSDSPLKINKVMTVPTPDGGAYLAWEDSRNGAENTDIFVQRLYPTGEQLWQQGGIAVATAPGDQSVPKLMPRRDGVLVAWNDRRNATDDNLYMQFLDWKGTSQWTTGGKALCTARRSQSSLKFVPSFQDTAFAIWTDTRALYASGFDLYMQKITPDGMAVWNDNGSALTSARGYQTAAQIVPRIDGGFVAAWMDEREGKYNIYLAGRNPKGKKLLGAVDGAISPGDFHQRYPKLLNLPNGGIALAWEDDRLGPQQTSIHFQQFTPSLQREHRLEGLVMPTLSPVSGRQSGVQLLQHPQGGVAVCWLEKYQGSNHLVYARIQDGLVSSPVSLLDGLEDFQQVQLQIADEQLFVAWEVKSSFKDQPVIFWTKMDLDAPSKVVHELLSKPKGAQREPHFVSLQNDRLGVVYSETGADGNDVLKLKWLRR